MSIKISDLTNYSTPVNTDVMPIVDTTLTTTKKVTWANIKATLKVYFDTLYNGTVSAVSVVSANGFNGTVANSTTTPAITLTTTISGILKGNGTAMSAASDGTDYLSSSTGELLSNKSTSTSLGTSNTLYPTQNAVKTYADGLVAGLLDYRGAHDASGNTYPTTGGSGTAGAILKGDMWIISVAGTLGSVAVQIGDSIIANVDTPGSTAANWNTLNTNISYVPEDSANKVTSVSGASTDAQYPSAKLLYDQLALKLATGGTATTTNALQSASTTVNVSSATAPSSGQVLTATSSTAATWQTPAGGSTDYSCRVYQTGATALTTSWVACAFGAENFDTDTMHDNASNNTRITFTHAGKYMVGGVINTANNSVVGARIKLNGTTVLAQQKQGNSGNPEGVMVSTLYSFSAADYVELEGYASTFNSSGDGQTNFWAYKVA